MSASSSTAQSIDAPCTGLQIKKVEWQTKEVIVESATGEPSFEDVLAKIQKTGVRRTWTM